MITSFSGDHRFLSNFWMANVVFEGEVYPSSEHAYQAAKCRDAKDRWIFRGEDLPPGAAKRLGRGVEMRDDWEKVKVDVMLEIVRDKFTRHPHLGELLLGTGDQTLVEGNNWGDTFWGVCRGVGQNRLGHILMQVRSELRNAIQ